MTSVSVVVPLYRSRATVEALYQRLCAALVEERFEILFVDDHCPEDSFAAAQALTRTDPRVRAIRLLQNVGQQRAVCFGLGAARGAHVVVMDADLQDDPAVVPRLLTQARQGADAVFATRRGSYQGSTRLLTSRVFKHLLTLVSRVPRNAGMFLVVSAEVARQVGAQGTATPYVVFLAADSAARVEVLEVTRAARPVGRSAYSSLARLKVAIAALRCIADTRLGRVGQALPPVIERSVGW